MSFIKNMGRFFLSKSFWINLILILLFWVVLIWVMVSYFSSSTNHGEKIKVPTLVTEDKSVLVNVKDVAQLLKAKSLNYEVVDSLYRPSLVDGTVIFQDPLPTEISGQYVKSNRVIKLRVSKSTRDVTVPNLVDKSIRFGEGLLSAVGLRSKVSYVPSDAHGSIISAKYKGKMIAAGAKLPINAVIELTVGKKQGGVLVNVPDLKGLTIKEAKNRLNSGGSLSLYVSCKECLTKEDSLSAKINMQTPVAGEGSVVPQGATITAFATLKFEEINPE